jgi:hypothetical protein
MECPWCDKDLKDYDELNAHMLKTHQEVTQLADYQESKTERIWGTAVDLCAVCFHFKDAETKRQKELYRYCFQYTCKSIVAK